jgi:hypothetical protein
MFSIVVILIALLVFTAFVFNSIQKQKVKIEAERKSEIHKQKTIIENLENALMSVEELPISQRLIFFMRRRILLAMRTANRFGDKIIGSESRIKEAEHNLSKILVNTPSPSHERFQLPHADKQVIQIIRGVRHLRKLLRSEFNKHRVDVRVYFDEDKLLESLQLRINIETLIKRSNRALKNEQLGSAKSTLEKAITILSSQPNKTEYISNKQIHLEKKLSDLSKPIKVPQLIKEEVESKANMDAIFGDKKKW